MFTVRFKSVERRRAVARLENDPSVHNPVYLRVVAENGPAPPSVVATTRGAAGVAIRAQRFRGREKRNGKNGERTTTISLAHVVLVLRASIFSLVRKKKKTVSRIQQMVGTLFHSAEVINERVFNNNYYRSYRFDFMILCFAMYILIDNSNVLVRYDANIKFNKRNNDWNFDFEFRIVTMYK